MMAGAALTVSDCQLSRTALRRESSCAAHLCHLRSLSLSPWFGYTTRLGCWIFPFRLPKRRGSRTRVLQKGAAPARPYRCNRGPSMRACMHAADWPVHWRSMHAASFFHRDVWHSGVWQVCLSLAVSVEIGKAGRIGRHLRGTGSMARGQAVAVVLCYWCHGMPVSSHPVPCKGSRPGDWASGTMYSLRQFLLSDGCLFRHVPTCSLKVENADTVYVG